MCPPACALDFVTQADILLNVTWSQVGTSSQFLGLPRFNEKLLIDFNQTSCGFSDVSSLPGNALKKTSTPLQLSVPGVSKRAINHRWIILSRSSAEAICLCLACSLCLCTHCNQRFCIFWMKFCKLICSKKQNTLSVAFKAKFKQVFDN